MDELSAKIENLIQAVQLVANKVDEIAQRQDELDSVVYDGLIGPTNEHIAQQEYDTLSDWRFGKEDLLFCFF
jgi:hypothetical protein